MPDKLSSGCCNLSSTSTSRKFARFDRIPTFIEVHHTHHFVSYRKIRAISFERKTFHQILEYVVDSARMWDHLRWWWSRFTICNNAKRKTLVWNGQNECKITGSMCEHLSCISVEWLAYVSTSMMRTYEHQSEHLSNRPLLFCHVCDSQWHYLSFLSIKMIANKLAGKHTHTHLAS